jgi:hypothetical protein
MKTKQVCQSTSSPGCQTWKSIPYSSQAHSLTKMSISRGTNVSQQIQSCVSRNPALMHQLGSIEVGNVSEQQDQQEMTDNVL